jgi:hypothetical protein
MSRPDTWLGGTSDNADGGLDTGCTDPHPVNASKATTTAAVAARFVMPADFSLATAIQSRHQGLNLAGPEGSIR